MSTSSGPRSWFMADMSIAATTLWLCAWCWNLASSTNPEVIAGPWRSWMPTVAIPGFIIVAVAIGLLWRKAAGFLPYALRWLCVAAGLALSAWIIISLLAARPPSPIAELGAGAKREVSEAMQQPVSPERRKRLVQAQAAAEAGERLAVALELAEASGITPPKPDTPPLAEDASPRAREAATMQEVAALLLEHGDDLAAGRIPEEVIPFAKDAGLDGSEMAKQAALFLASRAIAYYFGAPYAIVFDLLVALLDDGEITLGELVRLGAACAMAVTPSGGFDAELFVGSFERIGVQANVAAKVMDALEHADVDVPDELVNLTRQAAGQATPALGACDEEVVAAAYAAAGCGEEADTCRPNAAERLLQHDERAACRGLSRAERQRRMLEYVRDRHPERTAEFERAWSRP